MAFDGKRQATCLDAVSYGHAVDGNGKSLEKNTRMLLDQTNSMPLGRFMAIEHDIDSALARAVRAAGSQSEFGRLIGRRQSTVSLWLKRNTPLPAEHIEAVQHLVPKEELRPDLPWGDKVPMLSEIRPIPTIDPAS